MSKFIIIEGTDNCGKSTQAEYLIKNLSHMIFHKIHYSSLPFKDDKKKNQDYSLRMYNDMFRMMKGFKDNNINIIFDRSHLGESVYAPLYRGYSGDYVFNLEKEYVNDLKNNLYLITLTNDPNIIMSRDDGKSFYENEEGVKAEVDGFQRAHRMSHIKNKLLINVGTMNAEDVSNLIFNFIQTSERATSELEELKQLTLFNQ
jgi:thymidylate kinase